MDNSIMGEGGLIISMMGKGVHAISIMDSSQNWWENTTGLCYDLTRTRVDSIMTFTGVDLCELRLCRVRLDSKAPLTSYI